MLSDIENGQFRIHFAEACCLYNNMYETEKKAFVLGVYGNNDGATNKVVSDVYFATTTSGRK